MERDNSLEQQAGRRSGQRHGVHLHAFGTLASGDPLWAIPDCYDGYTHML